MSNPSRSASTVTAALGRFPSADPTAPDADRAVLRAVFERLPHVLYCEKDHDGAYIAANLSFARRCGLRTVDQVVGRRAGDLFRADLAASYEAQDRAVLRTGHAVVNLLEVIGRAGGGLGWFLTTKVAAPARCLTTVTPRATDTEQAEEAEVVTAAETSLVVVSVDLNASVDEGSALDNLSGVLAAIRREPVRAWRVSELAFMAGVSERQLERRMQRLLGTSTKALLQSLRVDHAAQMLVASPRSLAEVAEACGYYDQSQLTRQFRAAKGVTPGQYRRLSAAHSPAGPVGPVAS